VSFPQLILDLKSDTLGSLGPFGPELALCVTIVLLLFARLFSVTRRIDSALITLIGATVALYLASPWTVLFQEEALLRTELFTGLLVHDGFSVFVRSLLMLFIMLFVVFTKLSGIPDREDGADFYSLVLGATLGMCIMVSANHLLTIFLGVEMASVPSYVLAGIMKGRRESSEAAFKYAVFGAGAAGVMLYGLSLLAGLLGSVHLPTMANQLADLLSSGATGGELMVLSLGGLMMGVGLAFKLSAFPFHFWCPDVFEGAAAEVGAFLSIASKAAAIALLVRVTIGLGSIPPETASLPIADGNVAQVAQADDEAETATAMLVSHAVSEEAVSEEITAEEDQSKSVSAISALAPAREFMAKLIALLAVLTCTFGNLAAYGQTNIKRLFAYSAIAHAGFMMMAVPAALALIGTDPNAAQNAVSSLLVYLSIYLFMNLGAFAVVAFVRNTMHTEEIADYSGMIRRSPGLVICFSAMLISLVGIPPLAGFVGKFAIFASLAEGYQITQQPYLMVLLWVGGMNTAISLFYYLRVVKVMTMDAEPEDQVPVSFSLVSLPGAFLALLTVPVMLLMLSWNGLNEWALAAVSHLVS